MLGDLPATGLTTITSTRGVATTTELTLVSEALAVFETAYYLVTGATPRQDGWVPRVLSTEEYFRLIDEKAGGDPELEAALAFCCPPADGLLEVIVDGGSPSQSVIGSLAHEVGHARQRLSNPAQSLWRNPIKSHCLGTVSQGSATDNGDVAAQLPINSQTLRMTLPGTPTWGL